MHSHTAFAADEKEVAALEEFLGIKASASSLSSPIARPAS
jgi:hypothetical protein